MRYNKLDLNLLTALKALLREKSVTRAAEAAHVSQPAMSGILGRLRDYFDDQLIVPVGRKMELTPLAEGLLRPLNDLLLHIDATIGLRPEFSPATSRRHFSLIASDYCVSVLVADVIQLVQREAPGVTLDVWSPRESQSLLESGDVDFVLLPEIYTSRSQPSQPLYSDSYVVIADRNNDRLGDSIDLEQYLEQGHVAYQARNNVVSTFESWFPAEHGDTRRVEVSASSFLVMARLVIGTPRIATVQARLASKFVELYPVRLIETQFEMPILREVLQWHQLREGDPAARWLRSRILEVAANMPPASRSGPAGGV